jgi:phosphoribosylamine-glycine ligase
MLDNDKTMASIEADKEWLKFIIKRIEVALLNLKHFKLKNSSNKIPH